MSPQRVHLSRKKGFNLQAASMAINGLPAVKVDRTTKWGNPFAVAEAKFADGHSEWAIESATGFSFFKTKDEALAASVEMFRNCRIADRLRQAPGDLRGKNLACWCSGPHCHADVLLEIANAKEGL